MLYVVWSPIWVCPNVPMPVLRAHVRVPMFIYMLNAVQHFSNVCFGVRAIISIRFFVFYLIQFILMLSLVYAQRLSVHLSSKQCLRIFYSVHMYLAIARVFFSHIIFHHTYAIVGGSKNAPSNSRNLKRRNNITKIEHKKIVQQMNERMKWKCVVVHKNRF